MRKHEQWDLKVSPAKCLLNHRRGTHADLARRLVTNDLSKTRRRKVTLLKLALIAFNVLCEQLGKDTIDVKGGTTREAVVKEWIRGCIATVTARLDNDALDLWLLCGKKFDMKDEESKTADRSLRTARRDAKVTVFSGPLNPSKYTRLYGNSTRRLHDTSRGLEGRKHTQKKRGLP